MEISREFGQDPFWFYEQEKSKQITLLAWYRIKCDPGKKPKRRAQKEIKKTAEDFWGFNGKK